MYISQGHVGSATRKAVTKVIWTATNETTLVLVTKVVWTATNDTTPVFGVVRSPGQINIFVSVCFLDQDKSPVSQSVLVVASVNNKDRHEG